MINAEQVIADLKAEVAEEKDELAQAGVLIQSLVAEIKNAATQNDLQAVVDLTTEAHAQAQALVQIVKQNSASGSPNV